MRSKRRWAAELVCDLRRLHDGLRYSLQPGARSVPALPAIQEPNRVQLTTIRSRRSHDSVYGTFLTVLSFPKMCLFNSNAGMDTLRSSTTHLHDPVQTDAFQELSSKKNLRIAIEFTSHSDFNTSMSVLALPGLRIGAATLSTMQSCGPTPLIDDDGLVLVILEAGAATARQLGRECTISAGEAILTGNDAPATFVGHTPTRWINLRFDRRKLDLLETDGRTLRPLPRSNHALRLLNAYVNLVLSLPSPPHHAARLAADHIYDLAALALGVARDREELGPVGGVRAARLAVALSIIRSDFADPALVPAAVAARVGISTRYLHKLLQETGASFSERVQDLRLAKAFVLLTGRDRRPARIIEAAHAAGFNDLSHFNRIFRRKYGLTPTAVRGRDGTRLD